jgi:DNA-binding GntR family transcriptional regulator
MIEGRTTRTSGAQLVYAELKRRILELEIEPGTRLYEPALAKDLEVSRTPLREAVRLLLAENLLEQLPTGGVVAPTLDAKEISELYGVRASLEALMAVEACQAATADDIARLEALVERNAALVHLAEDAMHAGGEIHALINTIAGNSWAIRLHEQIINQMQRYRAYTNRTQERRNVALAEHRELVNAIAARDKPRVRDLALDHVIGARDEAIRAINALTPQDA